MCTKDDMPNNIFSNSEQSDSAQNEGSESGDYSASVPLLTEDRLRRKLQFFFMNPIEKWQAKRRFPYKFIIQVVKIVFVTLQLCMFATARYNHVNYVQDSSVTFSHLFLKDWDPTREVYVYPPAAGPLAIYKIGDFYNSIDYAYHGYSNLLNAIGSYSYANEDNTMADMNICLTAFKEGKIFGFNESYVLDSTVETDCFNFTKQTNFSSALLLKPLNVNFDVLIEARLSFLLKTINFKNARRLTVPNCYEFNVTILFDNGDHDGQMLVSLETTPTRLVCRGNVQFLADTTALLFLWSVLNYLVILTCLTSLVLCCRAVLRAQQLKCMTNGFFMQTYGRPLNPNDKLQFLNMWYIMIIMNDILIIIGSGYKEQIERKDFTSNQWNVCSICLGVGNMLVWFGVLRYLGFFKTYNVVILTLKKATPQVARFLLCALLIYAGFTFCGWLVFGPYHLKFRYISTTSECLFSLINGDDMFATFHIMSESSAMLWWFSRLYLYSFISLYIYIILSLFISVIMDAYDTIKLYYKEGFPKSALHAFIGDTNVEDLSSGVFRSGSFGSLDGFMKDFCCCKRLRRSYSSILYDSNSPKNESRGTAVSI